MSRLPTTIAHRLVARPVAERWLIDGLWADQAVGIIGGEPKVGKSLLALDIAVCVAAGTNCLRHFPSRKTGRVLLYPAEDAPEIVRHRLAGICGAASRDIADLDIDVITAPRLLLDDDDHRARLRNTIAHLKPTLLVLESFIRLHRIDENQASEVAPILAFLRELQRRFRLAVILVHHARKGAHGIRQGQALRGSSELHGWGDSNLYLRRRGDALTLDIEHRAAPSRTGLALRFRAHDDAVTLVLNDPDGNPHPQPPHHSPSPRQRVLDALRGLEQPIAIKALRKLCKIRSQTLYAIVATLEQECIVERNSVGYLLTNQPQTALPLPSFS
jgi:hypothetical protein